MVSGEGANIISSEKIAVKIKLCVGMIFSSDRSPRKGNVVCACFCM